MLLRLFSRQLIWIFYVAMPFRKCRLEMDVLIQFNSNEYLLYGVLKDNFRKSYTKVVLRDSGDTRVWCPFFVDPQGSS